MNKLLSKLHFWMQPKETIFLHFAENILGSKIEAGKYSKNSRRVFIDNGGDVLFVAHLDTVLPPKIKKQTKKRLHASGLDDRLGCLLAYELGTKLCADILLTDDEEKCISTAQHHITKNYNWIVEFDRGGDDIVTYGIDNYEFQHALAEYWTIGFGSYSDIVDLPTLSCCFNLGIGYQHAHSKDSYVNLKQLNTQLKKFEWFYEKYSKTEFIADKQQKVSHNSSYIYDWQCDICGNEENVEEVHEYRMCITCFNQVIDNFFFAKEYDSKY
ncbi:hypothetical protein LCGC14_1484110 [marine sediment metagenome]|uniref:Peptidase M28 domain-containing protein n=1 Tax=marine sediment metagenome TaxID=412755 RepID=A0A0F9J996_9ZZZZ